jgi:hypothetical protein
MAAIPIWAEAVRNARTAGRDRPSCSAMVLMGETLIREKYYTAAERHLLRCITVGNQRIELKFSPSLKTNVDAGLGMGQF